MATKAFNYVKQLDISFNIFKKTVDSSINYIFEHGSIGQGAVLDGSGPITINATGIGPTLGTIYKNHTISTSNGLERRIRLILGFSGGTDGSGEYIYSLPSDISFNITKNPIYTGPLWVPDVGSMINYLIPTTGSIIQQYDWSIVNYIIPYSNTSYRIVSSSVSLSGFTTLSKTASLKFIILYKYY
jgi:hypothetical protein